MTHPVFAAILSDFAAAARGEYQRKWDKSERRDQIEASYLRNMPDDMRDGSFLNEYTDSDEWEEPLSRILAASYGDAGTLKALTEKIRDEFIKKHAERKAFTDSED